MSMVIPEHAPKAAAQDSTKNSRLKLFRYTLVMLTKMLTNYYNVYFTKYLLLRFVKIRFW